MHASQSINYQRIAEAIAFIQANFKSQPSLEQIAEHVNLSPFYLHRMFSEWAGVSPKKFMQYLSLEYAKQLLQGKEVTLFEAAQETGLSGTGRLHDLFVKIEGMTPGEFKNGGENLQINYSFAESPFGDIIMASTTKGICHLAFFSEQEEGEATMKARFPNATYQESLNDIQKEVMQIFQLDWSKINQIKLHLNGTPFQLKVWEALLKIPIGNLTTYGSIASEIEKPKASRAIGTAIGSNPVAFLIPCHRVIQSSGKLGGYMWGNTRKSAIIGWEAAQLNQDT
ncbi:AraC family transcriptional regulator of adaptative response/methylated-DNA-[protein]-cysteine methyltransferase [Algoriphagus ratkowskyi]|uniref:methylated-DNA--[protein]-cysteine S-methyltransferase n=1 Tax=Algoriphagus ratkowskyi TaxID=57028 RepID=A0A2W7R2E2_9BACT|nr:methylated-DNA--[protein]-cysteine S-methyltransferase [Algoriphagus ratkowskyi]PZX53386.1 AraC family transcriptional regulator of adaptative response/methylated-DNA-[protein]-cysteine methyltransferase [Algoriphagus ratkowskyi]TXD76568.1 methylated-DNA--[protein]-cysteine S-methyltransferase [Algoriphagus ratkowskyi]